MVSLFQGLSETGLQAEDGSFWGGSDEEFDEESELNREWKSRHDQFHTMGYRDGLIAGKEAAAQEGFNIGFKQSVRCGYNWGHLRGVTSALECLPSELKEVLVESQDSRNKFLGLYTSVHSIPTVDALKLCLEDLTKKEAEEKGELAETSDDGLERQISDGGQMGKYFRELKALLIESPKIESGFD